MLVGLTSALRGLATNKLRSFLTMLGVIFGVAAVIVAVALGQGSRDASMRRFQRLGTTTLTVFPGRASSRGISFGQVNTLKYEDAAAILRACPSVRRVSPEKSGFLQVKYGDKNTNTTVYGTGADFPIIRKFDFREGAYFTDQDVKAKRMVCVLGWQVYKDLFDSGPCVGRRVYIKGQSFKVLGLFAERGGGGFQNEDDRVYVPVTTALRRLFGSENVLSGMSVQGRSESLMQKAQQEVDDVLRKRHKIGEGKPSDAIIFNAATAAQTSSEQAADFEQLINCLAAVALIVGGIGIMNIMLVSVTERTREIGVRKAIGAKRRNILSQFLLEALFLSLTGGLIGVICGILFTIYGLPRLKPDWETTLTLMPTFVAFGFSALVGIFFGFYPALKASKLNPIEALRYE
ncbi:MAG TPA: ABC transporter permease [Chthonomonadaceae bacterium]|nr:ABC transporter permease [Chthonomonadaceae bacterium]